KPENGYWSKDLPHSGCAIGLEKEKRDQNRDRHRHHIGIEKRGRDMQSFDRAQDRDRRSDHPVGVEERRAKEAKDKHELSAPNDFADQGGESENAAFATIVRAQNKDQIFDRDNKDE